MDVALFVAGVNRTLERGRGEHTIRTIFLPHLRTAAPNIEAVNEPGATAYGNPDISVYRSGVRIGWVETKALGSNLDDFEHTDQFERYIAGFSNILVTNFNDFRWYLDHRRIPFQRERIGSFDPKNGLVEDTRSGSSKRLLDILRAFCERESRQARSAAELAGQLAIYAVAVRNSVAGILERGEDDAQMRQELEAFRAVLIPTLDENDFADMYAQTITYGLFAARCAHPHIANFDRLTAPQLLPTSNPFLRNVFGNLAGANLDDRIAVYIDQITLLLRTANLDAIVEEFKTRTGLSDPVVHFYETFLQTYDRDVRRDRGVYYTPVAVVSFIVRSVDQILRNDLGITDGLGDCSRLVEPNEQYHRVQILDPATGTGTFLLYLIDHLREQMAEQHGLWNTFVHQELLPRLYGFEYLMAPYAIAHLKVGMALGGQGFTFNNLERLGIYLTNTLEETAEAVAHLPFQNFLTIEAAQANEIKQQRPLMVILGNPPYSVRSANLGPNARRLVARYMMVDGERIREGGTLALQRTIENDYVKFVAFAQDQIERSGEGVVGYITANGYLDQPTLVGLRRSLMQAFDEVTVIDLHGYARAGTGDENVFTQIGEGVAIILLVRRSGHHVREARVRYCSIKGRRSDKRAWLADHHVNNICYETVQPSAPDYLFRPEDTSVRARYRGEFVGLDEVFQVRRGAIVTARDDFAIAVTQRELLQRLESFRDSRGNIQQASERLGLRWSGDWPNMATAARNWLRRTPNIREFIKHITYRPFDDRFVIYSDKFLDTPCTAVMDHMARAGRTNKLLIFGRSVRYGIADQFFVTEKLAEAKSGEASRQCHAAPLRLFHEGLAQTGDPNFTRQFMARIGAAWGGNLTADEIFAYIYGVLNCPVFRQTFAAQLCRDYARIPLLPLAEAQQVATLGQRMVTLHTLRDEVPTITGFSVTARETPVEALPPSRRWSDDGGGWRLWVNRDQYVSGVPDAAKNYRIAGYAVLEKWLQGREGRVLTVAEIKFLQRVVSILQISTEVASQIDGVVGPAIM